MSDDLVKRAREYGDDPQDVSLGEWAEWSHKWAARIEELEAKLAKAVEALSEIEGWSNNPAIEEFARTTLAELTGGKND